MSDLLYVLYKLQLVQYSIYQINTFFTLKTAS